MPEKKTNSNRRSFIKNGGMILAGSAIVGGNARIARGAHAFGSDTIRLGLVGCGRRGVKAAIEAMNTTADVHPHAKEARGRVELVALADVFKNNLHTAYRTITSQHRGRVQCDLSRYDGMDAYRGVMQSDADVVILATPPAFRPLHFEAAIAAGKHVFMEKPVAIDAPGVNRVLVAGEIAEARGLAVAVGLQRRHERRYRQTIQQIHSGLIGRPVFARTYCNVNPTKSRVRRPGESDWQFQLRNWISTTSLSGGLIGEQSIQHLDVINWVMGACPSRAKSLGRIDGEAIGGSDYQAIEFTYPGGEVLLSQSRQSQGCWNQMGEHVHCTQGSADISGGKLMDRTGKVIWKSDVQPTAGKGWQAEQDDFFAALRRGERPSETLIGAKSTLTAIMGRLATEQNGTVDWTDAASCKNRLTGSLLTGALLTDVATDGALT